jgi:hypothetical protein
MTLTPEEGAQIFKRDTMGRGECDCLEAGEKGCSMSTGFSRCLLDSHSLPPYELEIEYPDAIAAITARITRAYSSDNRKSH